MYNQKQTNIDKTIIEFNKQNNNIQFKIEKEHHNSIIVLSMLICFWLYIDKTIIEFNKQNNNI
jgi:hypothetical protein